MKKMKGLSAGLLAALLLAGCTGNPTNAPTEDAVKKANVDRAAAIDNDTSLTPEGKAKMKEMMGLTPGGRNDPGQGRK